MDAVESLLRSCQRGDTEALAALVRLYQERIFRLAYRMLHDAAAAEEAAAETLVKLWRKCGQWRGDGGANAWIYRLAVRTILDAQRGRRRWLDRWGAKLGETPDPRMPDPADTHLRREARRDIDIALAELAVEDRALLHLHYFENWSLAAIAPVLETSGDALKMRLMRLREKLRPRLRGQLDQTD